MASVAELVAPPKIQHTECFIDGQWRPAVSGKTFETINPATEQVICEVAEGDKADIDAAVQAARKAFERGPWSRMDARDRGRVMFRLADLIENEIDERLFLTEELLAHSNSGELLYLHTTRSCRGCGTDYPMEFSDADDRLEMGARIGCWMHHCDETSRTDTADLLTNGPAGSRCRNS